VAHRDLASRIHVRNAAKADRPEPTRMTRRRHRRRGHGSYFERGDPCYSVSFLAIESLGNPTEVAMHYETITRTVEVDFSHKKQIGGGGEYARVRLRLEPLPRGSGVQFANEVTDDIIRAEWISGIQEGIQQASKTGVVAGHAVVDLKVTLLDGASHDIDSNWHTFRLAAQGAFWDGMRKAGPKILFR
jgi:hypothetical protein